MISVIFNISLYMTALITILILILLVVKFFILIWEADRKRSETWMKQLFEEYLQNRDEKIMRRFRSLTWPQNRFLQYVIIYRSFGKTGEELAGIAEIYESLGFIERDLKRLRSLFWWVRAEGARCLGQMKAQRVKPFLLRSLHDRVVDVRLISAWALGRIGDADAIVPSMEALIDVFKLAGMRLSSTVFELGDKAIEPLMKTLNHSNASVRLLAIQLLAEIGNTAITPALVSKTVTTESKDIRIAAYKALGTLADTVSAEVLLEGLRDSMWEIRAQAARGLGNTGIDSAVEPLKHALGDTNWWVRRHAGESLTKLGKKGEEALREVYKGSTLADARDMAAQWLDSLGQIT